MDYPMVYELNARWWLRGLADDQGQRCTLGNVPEKELDRFAQWGVTHLWLMGAWTTGSRSKACSRRLAGLRTDGKAVLPDFSLNDIAGSPFAIAIYETPRALGGQGGLKKLRQRLSSKGIKLILDFVPNHTGLDHIWLQDAPSYYVQSRAKRAECFLEQTAEGSRWLAYGKDPFFPAWVDTAQLDYRNPATRQAMIDELRRLANLCDGVRCDMAMLLLNEVFARNWSGFEVAHPPPVREFWSEAIQAIRSERSDFLFLAEAYWDLEARLQELGFDYTYDKRLCDYMVSRNYPETRRHLFALPLPFHKASAHFLENHDEGRIASQLAWPEHRVALLITLAMPGLRLLNDGQCHGETRRVSVHCARQPSPLVNPEVTAYYDQLLTSLQGTAVGRGEPDLVRTAPAWPDNPTWQDLVIIQWQSAEDSFDLAVANLASHRGQGYARLTAKGLASHNWSLVDLLGSERYERRGDDLERQGLYLDVPGYATQLFHFTPVP
jgi:hypothetical protein